MASAYLTSLMQRQAKLDSEIRTTMVTAVRRIWVGLAEDDPLKIANKKDFTRMEEAMSKVHRNFPLIDGLADDLFVVLTKEDELE